MKTTSTSKLTISFDGVANKPRTALVTPTTQKAIDNLGFNMEDLILK